MSRLTLFAICFAAMQMPAWLTLSARGQETERAAAAAGQDPEKSAPALDPPQIIVALTIDNDENLVQVNFRTIFIGFDGYSYNNRSESKISLKDVSILTVGGLPLTVEKAREILGGKDTPILCSSWGTQLPPFYASMFSPETLHFVFPKKSPLWKKIQEPGRPIQ